ncbi:MAG TPA: hypothetical protein VFE23_18385 [Usitatibacter sp.]|nr:hypothetical protein [Usitatibacter sp.]
MSKRIAVAVVVVAALAGCTTLQSRKPEESVKERAQARWDALLKNDVRASYEYLSPGTRAVMDYKSYEASIRRGFWKSATVDSVTCPSRERCEVNETIEYEFQGRRARSPLTETWIEEGGNWWLVRK